MREPRAKRGGLDQEKLLSLERDALTTVRAYAAGRGPPRRLKLTWPGSSVVEHSPEERGVASSSLALGTIYVYLSLTLSFEIVIKTATKFISC